MTQENKERAIKKLKAKKGNGEIDYSVISFPLTYTPDITLEGKGKKIECVFRFQNFKEIRRWGRLISPTSDIHPGDRMEGLLESLQGCLLSPDGDVFETWFDKLLEPDIQAFIQAFGEAKGAQQKK